jgi:hypothetical protein
VWPTSSIRKVVCEAIRCLFRQQHMLDSATNEARSVLAPLVENDVIELSAALSQVTMSRFFVILFRWGRGRWTLTLGFGQSS